MAPITVGIVGASGYTGGSVADALLSDQDFRVVAFTRPESVGKSANQALQARGAEIQPLDLQAEPTAIVPSLKDIEILISAVTATEQLKQLNLATAAKHAGVKRFIPCGFLTIIPVGGVHALRDEKEVVYNHVKRLQLPYTILDVGWWTQLAVPRLPSGKTDSTRPKFHLPADKDMPMAGNGNVASALTDLRDIGLYTARIIKDPRTLNKMVFVYNEMYTENGVRDKVEKLTGETIPRVYNDLEALQMQLAEAEKKIQDVAFGPESQDYFWTMAGKWTAQYQISWGINGHNTPEWATYLGYINSKDLYPDFKFRTLEDTLQQMLGNEAT
ncbi:Hypothetical protein D9617_24g016900 [Elsinoe fawcettii]|nr:Hypothetical protein D9617_24g016900 [Elsinoe fawcettii]